MPEEGAKNLRQFIADVVICMEREIMGLATLSKNLALLDQYRNNSVVDEEVLEFVENVIIHQVGQEEDFDHLLEIFRTEYESNLLDRVKTFMVR